ncbi:MAG: GNVR domain-containing protein [Desulfatiglandales bacterium]
MNDYNDINRLGGIVRRRKKGFCYGFLLLSVIGTAVALILPPVYRSQSLILIEGQQIPQEYVVTTITSYVEERLQLITQQIMSRPKLLEIIDQFNLYPKLRGKYTSEKIIEKMRKDIRFETISADVIDRRTGRPTTATIAFSVSYEGKDPATVQKVTSVLASLYLEENLRNREQRASTTTIFLQQGLDELNNRMNDIQTGIGAFKQAHMGELPEDNPVNLQAIGRLDRELDQVESRIRNLKERNIFLEGQIAKVDPLCPIVTEDGKQLMNPAERLKFLRMQRIALKGSMTEKHPDLIKLDKEIAELEAEVGETDESLDKVKRLNTLTGRLAALQGSLGAKHPDVLTLMKEIETLDQDVARMKTVEAGYHLTSNKPDNPAYIQLRTQIASANMEIESLAEERRRIKDEIVKYSNRLANIPLAEKEYNQLLRDYENARHKYSEMTGKLMEARVSQEMEETQRGERFTIVEAAQLPEKPHKPNRTAIILISLVLALGAGVGIAALRESLDRSVKTADELSRLSDLPVLTVIPFKETDRERGAKRVRKAALGLGCVCVLVCALILVHLYVMPLEVLWAKLQRRASLLLMV